MMRATRRLVLMAALTVMHAGGVGRAMASEPEAPDAARAELLRAQADREFAAGNYQNAIEPLTEGYALTRDPRFLLNLGVTYHWLGECELARDTYLQFLQAAADGPLRVKAREALDALSPVCGRPAAAEPQPAPNTAPSSGIRSQSEASPGNLAAWSFLSVGAAALVGSAVSGALWWSSRSDYRGLVDAASSSGQTWDVCCASRGEQLHERTDRYRLVSAGLGIGSAVLIAAGVVLWRSGDAEASELSVAVGDGVGLRYGAAF